MMMRSLPIAVRPARIAGVAARLASGLALALTLGCSSPELEAVRSYRDFLERAKPSLLAMNQARQELYDLNEPDKMPAKFEEKLLPQIKAFSELADKEPKVPGKLGEIHEGLKTALRDYAKATQELTAKLKTTKDEDREKALLAWGQEDQKFGKQMALLVDDLSRHLDSLKQ